MKDNFDLSPLKVKKRKNSKQKGNTFERKVCDTLNERFGKDLFHRTPGSGAFATTHKLPDHLLLEGDIMVPLNFKFCIECKKGYNTEGLATFFKEKSLVKGFLEKLEKQARSIEKLPLLIIGQDRQPTLAITPRLLELESLNDVGLNEVGHLSLVVPPLYYVYTMLTLTDFLQLDTNYFYTTK